MANLRKALIRISSSLSVPRAFAPSPRRALTTILYHKFFAPGESTEAGIARLRRQLEWLQATYNPLSPTEAIASLLAGALPDFPIVVTSDDAKLDLLDTYRIFEEFEIPLTIAVAVGWADEQEALESPPTLSRVVNALRWYEGPERKIDLGEGDRPSILGAKSRDQAIDRVLARSRSEYDGIAERVWKTLSGLRRPPRSRTSCNWSELVDLHRQGAIIASHTVSHCRLADCSDRRLRFEVKESHEVLANRFGGCDSFAYPYGTDDVADSRTSAAVKEAGYGCAFMTNSGFAGGTADPFRLPRIVIPDTDIDIAEFRARVLGGQVPFNVMKKAILRAVPWANHAR